MLGALATLLFGALIAGAGRAALARWLDRLDPAAAWGVGGLFGLGAVGTATLAVGLLPGGLRWGIVLPLACAAYGAWALWRRAGVDRPQALRGWEWAFAGALALALLFALVCAATPSDMLDWDSLAYHLALAKLWLAEGRITYVSFIHHSNFPGAIDLLYVWGLAWGGQAGAKAFSVAVLGLGLITLFGLARQRYGERAGWWAALAFAAMPVVLWESGTAYIDVGHGLFAGLGLWFAARWLEEREDLGWLVLAGIGLGLGVGSKYTGLQTLAVAGLVVGGACVLGRAWVQGARAVALMTTLALVIGGGWYVKNVAWTGNPVFPFYFERFGGKNWSQSQADVYRDEQQSFGVGRDLKQFGRGVAGLAIEPRPFINLGQYPLGTLGAGFLATALLWAFAGRRRGRTLEGAVLAGVLLSMGIWFVLSQQSRYIVTLGVPLAIMAGGAVVRLRAGPLLAGLLALQAGYALWLTENLLVLPRLSVLFGSVSADTFLTRRVPFFKPAQRINDVVKGGKVALYDEVFGSLLDVPYFWANPGHSSEIPYASHSTGAEYAAALRRMGMTHVYVSLSPVVADPAFVPHWLASMGLGDATPLTDAERAGLFAQFQTRWKVLLADAVRGGQIRPVEQFRSGLLFEVVP